MMDTLLARARGTTITRSAFLGVGLPARKAALLQPATAVRCRNKEKSTPFGVMTGASVPRSSPRL